LVEVNLECTEFWRADLAQKAAACAPAIRIMEVCGTHTHAIARYNLRSLLPGNVTLISGPGCPVCVSGAAFIEKIRTLLQQGVTVALFGDLMRIPGTCGTLRREKNLKLIYSPADALAFAAKNPDTEVVFAAVGFSPTLSATAALMAELEENPVSNFSILSDFKEITPVLAPLCAESSISALLLPGHVATITGVEHFSALHLPAVVAGFEPENILHSLSMLLDALGSGNREFLYNNYPQAVRQQGNSAALRLIERYFETTDSSWRGLGEVPGSGKRLKEEYSSFDAEKRYHLETAAVSENPLCRCGEVLAGKITPLECPLFGKECTPATPVGACMASSEGSCSAAFIYGNQGN
jgi:hydrogenase expression/formation protein HypD